jgi:hypothetical protein
MAQYYIILWSYDAAEQAKFEEAQRKTRKRVSIITIYLDQDSLQFFKNCRLSNYVTLCRFMYWTIWKCYELKMWHVNNKNWVYFYQVLTFYVV